MSNIWIEVLTSLLRRLILLAVGPLVVSAVIPQAWLDWLIGDGAAQIAGVLIAVFLLAYGARGKLLEYARLKIALYSHPEAVTVEEIKQVSVPLAQLAPSTPVAELPVK